MKLPRAFVPTGPVPVIVDIFNVSQFVLSVDYVSPLSVRGFVPPGHSLDFFWEIVSGSSVEMRVLPFFVQL